MIDNLIKEALDFIISNKQIKTVFQPIVSLRDGSILGHEALSRITCASDIKNPEMLFSVAGKLNRLWDLELLCRTKALEAAYIFMVPPYNKMLFLNVNPQTMHDENFQKGFTKNFLKKYGITPNNVIFEITERNIITDMAGFNTAIKHYKSQNYKIAIDDAGAGYSGLNLISEVNPNYIKLDIKLIRNIHKDSIKFAIVKGMVEFSRISKVILIAEGIESYEELDTLVNLGVQYGQGYFFQKPATEIKETSPKVLMALKEINLKKNHTTQSSISNLFIKNLCTPLETISPDEITPKVYEKFKQDQNRFGLCIVEDSLPVGIITRQKLNNQLTGPFGFALYQNKPISTIMDTNYLSVDYQTPVNLVASIAMSRNIDELYDFIIVTEEEKYIGVVTIRDLLQKATEIEILRATHQNPLTGLPGNQIIENTLNQCSYDNRHFSVAYLDIDNFKAYNDVYGFENGDIVIRLLADIIKTHLSDNQFIGHVGGDDFVVVLDGHINDTFFKNIKKDFEYKVRELYNKADLDNGFISTKNRRGEVDQFPLITLTAVTINNKKRSYKNGAEISSILAGMKTIAKQKQCKSNSKLFSN